MADLEPDIAEFDVDISNCDREPIHVPGTIQPFGFLVALTADWLVSRVSANCEQFIGLAPEQMLGKPISDLFLGDAIHSLRNRITLLRGPDAVERIFSLVLIEGLSYKEAAEILGCPMGTLTSRLVRGREALLRALGETT